MKTPKDVDRLIHEALTQLGWDRDAAQLAAKVERLNRGLPCEDEFSVICSWLGKCDLIHKLDQKQVPSESSEKYQVPDLFAVFRVGDCLVPTLVEVKSSVDNVLSFRQDYLGKLNAYATMLRLPLLIAWKHYGIWTVFDSVCLQKAQKNFNINFGVAMSENLLGVLAGDLSYSLGKGAGLHLRFRKEELLETAKTNDGHVDEWKMICENVSFTNGRSEVVCQLPIDVQALFLSWALQQREEHTSTHVTISFVAESEEETAIFAHMALVRLLAWQLPAEDKIDWRALLSHSRILQGIEDFSNVINEALRLGIVHHVFHQNPRTWPAFLPSGVPADRGHDATEG